MCVCVNAYIYTNALGFARVPVSDTSRAFLCRISSIREVFRKYVSTNGSFLAKFLKLEKLGSAFRYVESRVKGTEIAIMGCPMLSFYFEVCTELMK